MAKTNREPCDFCDGWLEPRRVTVVRGRGLKLIAIEDVPALVCSRCGMRYYEAEAVRAMEKIIDKSASVRRKIRIPVAKFEVVA